MTRLELLAVLISLRALLEENKNDKALELVNELIAEAKRTDKKKNSDEYRRSLIQTRLGRTCRRPHRFYYITFCPDCQERT